MQEDKPIKQARLREGEFNPYRAFKSYWSIPKSLVAVESISDGAKIMYGLLVGHARQYGTAYVKKDTLCREMGYRGLRTLLRWQDELECAGLIRVHQKGKGLPNNYYFLCSYIVGNGLPGQSAPVVAPVAMRSKRRATQHKQESTPARALNSDSTWAEFEAEIRRVDTEWLKTQPPQVVKYIQDVEEWRNGGKVGPAPEFSHGSAAVSSD